MQAIGACRSKVGRASKYVNIPRVGKGEIIFFVKDKRYILVKMQAISIFKDIMPCSCRCIP
jgi:hypothetical protein